MSFEYSKLLGKIVEVYGTRRAFSKALSVTENTLSLKLSGKRSFTQPEIDKACSLLGIQSKEIPAYFFAHKV